MSTTETRLPLEQAEAVAEAFRALFAGDYRAWVVAGSVRRRKADVGDIEHVVIPEVGEVRRPGEMFADRGPLVHARLDAMAERGDIALARYGEAEQTRWGSKLRGLVWRGVKHEVYFATPENFGAILAIRTGPREHSMWIVDRLRQRGFQLAGGRVVHIAGQQLQHVPTESALYRLCGVDEPPPPEQRSLPRWTIAADAGGVT